MIKRTGRRLLWEARQGVQALANHWRRFVQKLMVGCREYAIRRRLHHWGKDRSLTAITPDTLRHYFFFATSFRVDRAARMDILSTTVPLSLSAMAHSGVRVDVVDASDGEWSVKARNVFASVPGIDLHYLSKSVRLPQAYLDLLRHTKQSYFCMLFDDQPMVGLTPSFLAAACQLLRDYRGLVDVVCVEILRGCTIDADQRIMGVDMEDLAYRRSGQTPLFTVTYGEHAFGILRNYQYGFFFNTLIASVSDYADRLEWFIHNVDRDSAHAIELAAARGRGPVYRHIAVPLNVFMLDLDFDHTDSSIRGSVSNYSLQIYGALRNNFQVTPGWTSGRRYEAV